MASLYELTGDYARFAEYMEQTELEPEMADALTEALANLSDDIEDKLENYAKIIRNFESDVAGLKAEEARLAEKRKAKENSIKRMKAAMLEGMRTAIKPDKDGKIKLKTRLFSFWVQKSAPAVVMDEAYIENIPEQYFKPHKEEDIDRKKIKADIESGVDLDGIAHLETSESIRIR